MMEDNKLNFIYWFAYYNLDSPSVRYRAKYPLDYFKKKHGIGHYLVIPGYAPAIIVKFIIAYLSTLFFPKKNSLIVIQRVNSNFIYSSLLKILVRIRRQNTVYDIDDADYLEYNPKTLYYFAKECKTISAGSRKIAAHLSQFNARIVQTTSPVVDLNIVKKARNNLFTIGWIGEFGGDHKDSLITVVFPALLELDFNFKLILIGVNKARDLAFITNYFNTNKKAIVEIPRHIDWRNEKDIQHRISSFDIGIATLNDTEFHKSKSGIKAKQYMNNGVPVLSTNLPENDAVIVDGKNGFFCSGSLEFTEKIIEFHRMNESEYNKYSRNARDSIRNFNHEKYLSDFIKIKQLCDKKDS